MTHWIEDVSLQRGPKKAATLLLIWLFCACAATGRTEAQEQMPAHPVTTLRIFENLLQIPVVVLGPMMELMRPVAPDRFFVSLDSGLPFRATHVRFEGDDPIALSVLIDVDSDQDAMMNELGKAVAHLGVDSLRSEDRISIYVLRRCEVWRPTFDAIPNLASPGKQITGLSQNWQGGGVKTREVECRHRHLLLDALARVINQSSTLPGRRVVLVVSDGEDKKSKHSWTQISSVASSSGVAVFGLQYSEQQSDGFMPVQGGSESLYTNLCESTGGLAFSATPVGLTKKMKAFIELLRKRYIIEFPRPDDAERGKHSIQVTIADSRAFVRSSGISVPIADPKTLADPNTIRSDPALAPQMGKRKPLDSPH